MKRSKFLWIAMLFPLCFSACKDDQKTEDDVTGVIPETSKVEVAFATEGITALRSAGVIRVPFTLSAAAAGGVKLTVAVVSTANTNAAKEGYDFQVVEKVVGTAAGQRENYVEIQLLNDEQVTADKEFEVVINSVYGYGKKGVERQRCKVTLVSNAFVEFDKAQWLTWESAAVSGDESVRKTRLVPLKITGTVTEATVLKVGVTDQTASEYTHFELASKSVTVNPGDEYAYVELLPVDDPVPNPDRRFVLTLEAAEGGNLRLGRNNLTCSVVIQSEEIQRVASFLLIETMTAENEPLLELAVELDKVPDEDVTLTFAAVDGTALAGVNYELPPTVVLQSGSQRTVLPIEIRNDGLCTPDLDFEVELVGAAGAHTILSEDKNKCKVQIENRNYPAFSLPASATLPEAVEYTVTVSLENPAPTDIPLSFVLSDTLGTDFELRASDVTIPAGSSSVDLKIKMVPLDRFAASGFTLHLTGKLFGKTPAEEIKTTVEIEEKFATYRKLLGTWTFSATMVASFADAGTKVSWDVTITSGATNAEKSANFNNKVLCTGFRVSNTYYSALKWALIYNAANGTVNIDWLRSMGTVNAWNASNDIRLCIGNSTTTWLNYSASPTSTRYTQFRGELNSAGTDITFLTSEELAYRIETFRWNVDAAYGSNCVYGVNQQFINCSMTKK